MVALVGKGFVPFAGTIDDWVKTVVRKLPEVIMRDVFCRNIAQ